MLRPRSHNRTSISSSSVRCSHQKRCLGEVGERVAEWVRFIIGPVLTHVETYAHAAPCQRKSQIALLGCRLRYGVPRRRSMGRRGAPFVTRSSVTYERLRSER
jgi:hypothetical protein